MKFTELSLLADSARMHQPKFREQFSENIRSFGDLKKFLYIYKRRYGHFNKPIHKAVKEWIGFCSPFEIEREYFREKNKIIFWSLTDIFRMFHPVPIGSRQFLYKYIVGKWEKGDPIKPEYKLIKEEIENEK